MAKRKRKPPVVVVPATPTLPSINGHYNNTMNDLLKAGRQAEDIAWMDRNRVGAKANYVSFYQNGSLLTNSKFPQVVKDMAAKNILVGIPWSKMSELDQAIAFNKANPGAIKFLTTEQETYGSNPNVTPAEFSANLKNGYAKAKAAGILSLTYNGRNTQYEDMVLYTDGTLLSLYREDAQIVHTDDLYGNALGRLNGLLPFCIRYQRKHYFSIILSTEAAYCDVYFKTHGWLDAYSLFIDSWNRLATADMKKWLVPNGEFVFVTKTSKVSKP